MRAKPKVMSPQVRNRLTASGITGLYHCRWKMTDRRSAAHGTWLTGLKSAVFHRQSEILPVPSNGTPAKKFWAERTACQGAAGSFNDAVEDLLDGEIEIAFREGRVAFGHIAASCLDGGEEISVHFGGAAASLAGGVFVEQSFEDGIVEDPSASGSGPRGSSP